MQMRPPPPLRSSPIDSTFDCSVGDSERVIPPPEPSSGEIICYPSPGNPWGTGAKINSIRGEWNNNNKKHIIKKQTKKWMNKSTCIHFASLGMFLSRLEWIPPFLVWLSTSPAQIQRLHFPYTWNQEASSNHWRCFLSLLKAANIGWIGALLGTRAVI